MRPRIKICGIPDAATARLAIAAGADAVGMIFHPPSRRHLELSQAAEISRAVAPFVVSVAVMVNPTAAQVREIIKAVRPTLLQFHGEESPRFCAGFGLPYIKTLRVGGDDDGDLAASEAHHPEACAILLDTHADDRYGGTGACFDWRQAAYGARLPLILAGGLHPGNVAVGIKAVAPYGVDVSSGVESNGRKDADKIHQFCRAVLTAPTSAASA